MGYQLGLINKVTTNTGYTPRSYCWDGNYLWVATDGNLQIYTVSGTTLSFVNALAVSGVPLYGYNNLCTDGTYVYLTCQLSGQGSNWFLKAFNVVSNAINLVATSGSVGASSFQFRLHYQNGYIFFDISNSSGSNAILKVYSFDGNIFTERGATTFPNTIVGMHGNGTYIFISVFDRYIARLSFNGSTFSVVNSITPSSSGRDMHCISGYVFTQYNDNSIGAYDSSLNFINSITGPSGLGLLWSDGNYIFISIPNSGVKVYIFNGSSFTLISNYSNTGTLCVAYPSLLFKHPCVLSAEAQKIVITKMILTATFTADKLKGSSPLTVNFQVT